MNRYRKKTYTDYAGDTVEVVSFADGVWFNNTVGADVDDEDAGQAANVLLSRKQVKKLRRELKLMLKEMK